VDDLRGHLLMCPNMRVLSTPIGCDIVSPLMLSWGHRTLRGTVEDALAKLILPNAARLLRHSYDAPLLGGYHAAPTTARVRTCTQPWPDLC
jgi:hypothetical protein